MKIYENKKKSLNENHQQEWHKKPVELIFST